MRTVLLFVIIAIMIVDAALCWCLLRAQSEDHENDF